MNDLTGLVLSQKYKLTKIISKGTFCKLYEALHIDKNIKVAIKVESSDTGKKILENEINIYLYLNKSKSKGKSKSNSNSKNINIPNIKYIGVYQEYKYIVMELLDKNLKDYLIHHNETNDFMNVTYDIIYTIYNFHERNLVHRDIKPENFIFDNKNNIYIIDFGLSAFFSNRQLSSFIGNKLYASYNSHLSHYVYKPTDDLISIIYMLFHLYSGILPWLDQNPNLYYNLKYSTNYVEYYKSIKKYDIVIQNLTQIYEQIHTTKYYENIFAYLNQVIKYC